MRRFLLFFTYDFFLVNLFSVVQVAEITDFVDRNILSSESFSKPYLGTLSRKSLLEKNQRLLMNSPQRMLEIFDKDFIEGIPIHGMRSLGLPKSTRAQIQLDYTDLGSDLCHSRQLSLSRTQTAAQSLVSSEFSFGHGLQDCRGVPRVSANNKVRTFKGRTVFTN